MALILFGVFLIQFDRNVLTVATVLVACVLLVTGIYQMFSMAPEVDYEAKGEVPLERVGHRLAQQVSNLLQRQPDMAETRETLQAKVFFEGPEAPVRFGRFAVLMAFASVIASIGVVAQSTAVVIGAMLIAPLMTPLLGMALSASMGWLRRFRRAAFVALAGIVVAIGTGVIVGAVSPHHVNVATNTEVLSRISPTILDLAIAVAAGAAGAFALSRRDVSDSLPGVAVAIALVPPLTVIGLCWQQGEWAAGNGALLLFLTNVTAILLAGGATFVLVGAAPLERVSAAEERVATLVVGLFSMAMVVLILLLLNGARLANAELDVARTDQVLADWADKHPDFHVLDQRTLSDGTIEVDLTGPTRPPGLAKLEAQFKAELADGAKLQISWYPRQQITVTGGP